MTKIVSLTTETFDAALTGQETPLLVKFYLESCTKCRLATPIIERLAEEFAGQLRVAQVDVAADPELKSRYEVRSGPTVIVFDGTAPRARVAGVADEAAFREAIEEVLGAI